MINDTIVNAKNFSDNLCNEVILWSNDFAHDLGVTYGELWCPKLKKTIKYTYWTIHGLIVLFLLFIFLMIGFAARADVELDRPFIGTKKMIIK